MKSIWVIKSITLKLSCNVILYYGMIMNYLTGNKLCDSFGDSTTISSQKETIVFILSGAFSTIQLAKWTNEISNWKWWMAFKWQKRTEGVRMIGCTILLIVERIHEFRLGKKEITKQFFVSERCDRNLNIYTVETLPLKPQRQCGFKFRLVSQHHFRYDKFRLPFSPEDLIRQWV